MNNLFFPLLLIILICCFYPYNTNIQAGGAEGDETPHTETSVLTGWHRDKSCNYEMIHVLKTFIKANNLKKNTNNNWQLYIPCGYNNSEVEFQNVRGTDPRQKVFIIKGCDHLSRKDTLWSHLRDMYGIAGANKIMPNTYILYNSDDLQRFKSDYSKDMVYILKKNIQRQEGLKMSKNKDEILSAVNQGYVVVQEMLQDPFLIDGRKTNCRYYLLVICQDGVKRGYIYTNGFMYYTPLSFERDSMVMDKVITAGLATKRRDSKFYETHPLTLQQFQKYMDNNGYDVNVFRSVGALLGKVLRSVAPYICTPSHLDKQTTFQLFGCDIAFNNKLIPQLMEINKGPDLSSKTEEEVQVKNTLINLIFQEIGLIPKDHIGKRSVLLQVM